MKFIKKAISIFKASLSGIDHDFTKGNQLKAIILLSIPMILEMIMESIFAVADIFFVSKLGHNAVSAVGITESMMTIVYSIGVGLSAATTAIVARRIGEKKNEDAANSAVQAILFAIIASIPISLAGIFFSKELLSIMGADKNIIAEGYWYIFIMMSSNFVILLLFTINAIFRSAGDAAISMKILIFANLLNIILDPCFIFGLGPFPKLGVAGAAVATTIGRSAAVILQFYILFYGKKKIQLSLKHLKIDFEIMKNIINLSRGTIFQHLIATSSWIALVKIISVFGSQVIAGYTIAIRIILFAMLPAWGFSNAVSTLVGQNLGANQPERAEKAVKITGILNMSFMGVIGFFLIIFSNNLVGLFINETDVIQRGTECLQLVSFGFLSYALGMILVQALNGAGDTNTPMYLNILCFWLIEIPLAYLLAIKFQIGAKGAYIAIITAETTLTVITFIIFRQGKWKLKKV